MGPAHPESTQVGPARPADDLQGNCRRQAYVDPSGSCSSRVDPIGSCSSCRQPADDLQTPGLSRPKWVLLIQSRPKWVLLVQSSTLLSLVHLGDGPWTRLSVPRTTHLVRGVIRLSGNSSEDKDPSSQNRQQRDDQQDEEDTFRPASLDLLLNYITKKFPAASQPNPWSNLPPSGSTSWRVQVSWTSRPSSPPI